MKVEPALMTVPDAEPAAPKLSARGVTKTFRSARGGTVIALHDVDLEVAASEFVCLIGPSGCGKTTLLNLFAGLERPDTGEVSMDGVPIDAPGPDRAVLFQEPALFPWMSVRANVEFGLEMIGVPKDERADRTMHWLRRVHLARFAQAQPHELSGGMRSRAALARSLACQPEVLLADEPFAALDAQTREILQRELQEVWGETRNTFVFVTHNVREAVRLGDRVILLSSRPGRIIDEFPVDHARPRRIDSTEVAELAAVITDRLREEVSRHAH